jgi:dipeptidyl aminopeptidase/acylaminoacyl peptidase
MSGFNRLGVLAAACAALWVLTGASGAQTLSDTRPPAVTDFTAPAAMTSLQLSPDGRRLLYIRNAQPGDPEGTPVMVVIVNLTDPDSPAISRLPLPDMDVRWVAWGNNQRILLGLELTAEIRGGGTVVIDGQGQLRHISEVRRSQIMSVRADATDPVMLFDFSSRRFNHIFNTRLDNVTDFLRHDPEHVLIPARSASGTFSLYRVNIETGRARVAEGGSDATIAFFTNSSGQATMRWDIVRFGRAVRIMVREPGSRRWRTAQRVPINEFGRLQRDYEWVARAESDSEALVYWRDPQAGTTGLYRYAFSTGELAGAVFSRTDYDIGHILIDPVSFRAIGVSWSDTHRRLEMFDPQIARHVEGLKAFFGEDTLPAPVQQVGERLLIRADGPTEPGSYYLYDMNAARIWPLGHRQPLLAGRALARVEPHHYTARDGTQLFGYLTIPAEPAGNPPPLVVMPHGGPELRDHHEFDRLAQLVASAGYLVFQPQFRGSYGFGREFAEAGYGQWGDLIQSDITDGARDVLARGLADPGRVCAVGWSFGGYSALMQAILEPDMYRCIIAGAAPTDLPVMLDWIGEDGGDVLEYFHRAMGDPRTDMDRLIAFSPARRAAEIRAPVLLLHGRRDGVVPVEQSELMAEALSAVNADHNFVPHLGNHGISTDSQWTHVATRITLFLHEHLQPMRSVVYRQREIDPDEAEEVTVVLEPFGGMDVPH